MNDEYKKKLTNSLIRLQEWSTTSYSLARRPKAPDKRVRCGDDRLPIVLEDLRGHHNGTRETKRSDTNIDQGGSDNKDSRLMKEGINKRGMACIMPSLTNKNGGTPVTQGPMHSKMRNEHASGPQMAVDSHQRDSSSGLHRRSMEGQHIGMQAQSDGGVKNKGHSKLNVEQKKELTKASVSQNERSTVLYSPNIAPKAPDKRAQCTDDELKTEAHYAPWQKGRDHVNNVTWWETRKLTKTRQQSQCNMHHKTENAAWGCVRSNRGSTAVGTSTNTIHRTGKAIQKPACNDNNDWSSSGPECGAKNDTEQLSEHSDELSEALSDVREPDKDHTGSLSETVHMACMWEIHHYQVDKDSDDREPHPDYKDEIIPCNDAWVRGQNCESPVERHWVESEVPDWIQDSDENSPECEEEDDNEDDFEEESEAEEDPFVDKLELKVENW
jgi:hypothetical protein